MKRTLIIITLFVVIVGTAYGIMQYLSAQKESPKVKKAPEMLRYVKAQPIIYANVNTQVNSKGRVIAVASVEIVAEGSGKILEGDCSLKNGQNFQKGEILFSIYKDEVALALKARKSDFLNALASLLPDLKVDYPEKYPDMLQFFNAIDVQVDLPLFPVLESDQLKIFLASRSIFSDYYSIQKDELALKRYTVYAPFDGTYAAVYLETGAYTSMGGRVAKAIRTDVVEVEVAVDAENADFISIGDRVEVVGMGQWTARVERIAGYVDETTQSRMVYVKIENQKKMPIPGQYVSAFFSGKVLSNAMEIPRNAVFNSNEVYTIVDGRLRKREINVLKRNEKTFLINGIEEGEILVTQALIGVSDGAKVHQLDNVKQKGDQKKESQR
jgi:multidrug efflux pump subunit AcrA (membrane-fusion protein)